MFGALRERRVKSGKFFWVLAFLAGAMTPWADAGSATVAAESPPALRFLRGHKDKVWAVAFSPDGMRLASSAEQDEVAIIWNVASAQPTRRLRHGVTVGTIAFSPNGKMVATGGADSKIRLWDVEAGRLLRTFVGGSVESFTRDGRTLISLGGDKTSLIVQRIDVRSGMIRRTTRLPQSQWSPSATAISPDGTIVVIGEENGASLYDVRRGILVQRLGELPFTPQSPYNFEVVAVSPDDRWVATNISQGRVGSNLVLWDARRRTEALRIQPPPGGDWSGGWGLAFSLDSRTLAAGSSDMIALIDVKTGMVKRSMQVPPPDGPGLPLPHALWYSPDGTTLAIADRNVVLLWTMRPKGVR